MTGDKRNNSIDKSSSNTIRLDAFVFDMDGTLYQFPAGVKFGQSSLGVEVYRNTVNFLSEEFSITQDEAILLYAKLKSGTSGGVSLELEKVYGIERNYFFSKTWDLAPDEHIVPEKDLPTLLDQIEIKKVLLSAAPRIWIDRALGHMGVLDRFGDKIYSGESDIRKPNPDIFRKILGDCAVRSDHAISIGDQEHSDIIPARQIGMVTLKIGEESATSADFAASNIADAISQLKQAGCIRE